MLYGQFLDTTFQANEDDLRFTSAPAKLLSGPTVKFGYIPRDDSTYATADRVIFSIRVGVSNAANAYFAYASGACRLWVVNSGSTIVQSSPLVFSAGEEIVLVWANGSVTISGCESGDGTYSGSPWSLSDNVFRIGGDVNATGKSARGGVSQPYAVFS